MRFIIPLDHPSLEGHFPGNPLVPGVVVLDHVLGFARTGFGVEPAGLAVTKFLAPLRPGREVVVQFGVQTSELMAFSAVSNGRAVVRGAVRLLPDPAAS